MKYDNNTPLIVAGGGNGQNCKDDKSNGPDAYLTH